MIPIGQGEKQKKKIVNVQNPGKQQIWKKIRTEKQLDASTMKTRLSWTPPLETFHPDQIAT